MNSYENEIMDLLPGNTPKEKYENLVKLTQEHSYALGRIEFIKSSLDSFQKNAPFLNTTTLNWIDSIITTLNTNLNPFPPENIDI